MKVALYYRYSTDSERQKANSEQRQMKDLVDACVKNQWTIVWKGGDAGVSGDSDFKPALEELKALVRSGELLPDLLFVTSFDRLTRKDSLHVSEDVAWLQRSGIGLAILDQGCKSIDLTNNQELLMLQMKVYVANQYLKDLI